MRQAYQVVAPRVRATGSSIGSCASNTGRSMRAIKGTVMMQAASTAPVG